MRFAYADPPYLGCAATHYGDHTYDDLDAHRDLIWSLVRDFPDGWAYSLTSTTLQKILPLCPHTPPVRVMAWVKPFASFKPNVNPAYAWEPVIVQGGRKRTREAPTVRDWCAANITMQKGLAGAKPVAFCRWLFDVLGAEQGDELHDVFPGTGIVTQCWDAFITRTTPNALLTLDLGA